MNLNTKDPTKPGLIKNVETIKLLNSTRCYMAFTQASKDYQELAQYYAAIKESQNLPKPTAQEVVSRYQKALNSLYKLSQRNFKSEDEFKEEISKTFYTLNWNMGNPTTSQKFNAAELALLYDYALHMRDLNIYNKGRKILEGYTDQDGNKHPGVLQTKKDDKGNTVTVVNKKVLTSYQRTLSSEKNFFAHRYIYDKDGYLDAVDDLPNPFMKPMNQIVELDENTVSAIRIGKHPYLTDGVFSHQASIDNFPNPYVVLNESEREKSNEQYGPYCSSPLFIESLEQCAPIFLRNRHYHYLKDSCDILKSVDPEYLVLQGQPNLDKFVNPYAFGLNISGYQRQLIQDMQQDISAFESDPEDRNLLGNNKSEKKDAIISSKVEEINEAYKKSPGTKIGDALAARKTFYVNHRTPIRKLQTLVKRGLITGAIIVGIATAGNAIVQGYTNAHPSPDNPVTISQELNQEIENDTADYSSSVSEAQEQNAHNYSENVQSAISEQLTSSITEEHPDWNIQSISIEHRNANPKDEINEAYYAVVTYRTDEHPYFDEEIRVQLKGQVFWNALNERADLLENPDHYDETSESRLAALTQSKTSFHHRMISNWDGFSYEAEDNIPVQGLDFDRD